MKDSEVANPRITVDKARSRSFTLCFIPTNKIENYRTKRESTETSAPGTTSDPGAG
jgi:hypothetical protein